MKKYTLILSVFIFILGFLGLFTSNTNVANAANCAPGDKFSTSTGRPCGNTSFVVECRPGDLFSSVTGLRCTTQKGNTSIGYLSVSPNSASIKAGETTTLQAIYQPPMPTCLKDFACVQMMPASYPVQATWTSSNTNVAKVEYKNTCPPGAYCFVGPDFLTAVVTGVSSGTATITASYKDGQLVATAFVTVSGSGTSNSITVTSPNGGESWVEGTTKTIYWQANKVGQYDVFLETYRAPCTGQICPMYMTPRPYPIARNVYSSSSNFQGSYAWPVGYTIDAGTFSSGQYMIQVCESGTEICDSSNNYFYILPAAGVAPDPGVTCLGGAMSCVKVSYITPNFGQVGTQVGVYGSGFTFTGNKVIFGKAGNVNGLGYNSTGNIFFFMVPLYSEYTGQPISPGDYDVYVTNSRGTSLPVTFTVTGLIR